jgi:hypothetical protein
VIALYVTPVWIAILTVSYMIMKRRPRPTTARVPEIRRIGQGVA